MDYFGNNPDDLDSPDEARMAVWEADGDPMNIGTEQEATFAWSILNSWEDDPPESRSDPSVFAAEVEMVADELQDDGVEVDDWPDIRGAPDWYGPE